MPEELIVDPRTEIRSVETIDGVLVVAMNVPLSVDEAHAAYLEVLRPPRYELINEENEGFEMEAYARRRSGGLVAIQARNPGCPEAVSIYVQLGEVPSPVGKGVN